MAMNRWMGPSHKEVGTKTPRCALLKAFRKKKMLHRLHPAEHSVWAQIHVHRVTYLEKFPNLQGWSSDTIASSWAFVYSPLSFHFSQALLGAWCFGLFRCVYSSFHNRLDLIREPAFYWVFYFIFPIYPCLFHHMQRWKSFVCSSSIDQQFHGLPGLGFGVGLVTGSCHWLFFSLCLPFCFLGYSIHLWCTTEGGSLVSIC